MKIYIDSDCKRNISNDGIIREFDVSSIFEKCYPCMVGEILSGGGASANLTATKIWFER